MILLLLQLFSAQIDSAVEAYYNADDSKAYQIAYSIPLDSIQDEFEYYEVLELRGLLSKRLRKFDEAKEIYAEVIQCEYPTILYKAYINYADVHYLTFDFHKRLEYLRKAYEVDPTGKVIRNIARHHIQVTADYEKAQEWIDKHPESDEAGYYLLLAEFTEAKRRYDESIDYYNRARIEAEEAGMFNYELFAREGIYRASHLIQQYRYERFEYWLEKIILGVLVYFYVRYKTKTLSHDKRPSKAT